MYLYFCFAETLYFVFKQLLEAHENRKKQKTLQKQVF